MDLTGTLHPKTVGDASASGWVDLMAKCKSCGHEAHVPWSRLRPATRLDQIGPRMKCQGCGHRGAVIWPWMDEREFARLRRLVRS